MTGLRARVAAWFLAPAEEAVLPAVPAATRRRTAATRGAYGSATVVVLGPGADVAGAAVGRALARAGRVPVALVACWCSPRAPRGIGLPAAAAAAAKLRDRGHTAHAVGRAVVVALAADGEDAARELVRAGAAAGNGGPLVLAVCRERTAALDAAFADADLALVLVAEDADAALAELATTRLRTQQPGLGVVAATAPVANGLLRPRPRAAVRAVMEALA